LHGYANAIIHLPHDGINANNITGKRYVDHFHEAGFNCAPPLANEGSGAASMRIEAVRRLLPRCWFNEETTEAGRDALGYYHENATRLGTSGWDRLMIGQAMRATLSAGCALPMRSSHDRYSKLQSQDRNAEGRNCVTVREAGADLDR
jgi:hypothetical protein